MRLFRRGDDDDKPEDTPERRPHSHVALAPEDVDDSERCRPDVDLNAFAEARGLIFGGSIILGTFVGVLPTWAEYVFNSSRGELAPGRFGLVEHELLEIPVNQNDPSGSGISGLGGQFWAVKRGFPPNWKKRLIPGVIELGMDEPPNEPFAAYATWAPVTSVYVHVPEAACAPRISVGSAERHNAIGNTSLDDIGLPQYRLLTDIPEDLRIAALGGPAGQALNSVDAPYVSMLLSFSQLRLMRNGFVTDEAELDALIASATVIADGLAAACSPDATTRPFDTPLPTRVADRAPRRNRQLGRDVRRRREEVRHDARGSPRLPRRLPAPAGARHGTRRPPRHDAGRRERPARLPRARRTTIRLPARRRAVPCTTGRDAHPAGRRAARAEADVRRGRRRDRRLLEPSDGPGDARGHAHRRAGPADAAGPRAHVASRSCHDTPNRSCTHPKYGLKSYA